MVAALCLFDEHAAVRASLPLLEVVLKVGITGSLVSPQHAFLAEKSVACLAGIRDVGLDDSLAVLSRTEPQVGVIDGLLPQLILFVLLLVVLRDIKEAAIVGIDTHGAVLLRTGDFLED